MIFANTGKIGSGGRALASWLERPQAGERGWRASSLTASAACPDLQRGAAGAACLDSGACGARLDLLKEGRVPSSKCVLDNQRGALARGDRGIVLREGGSCVAWGRLGITAAAGELPTPAFIGAGF